MRGVIQLKPNSARATTDMRDVIITISGVHYLFNQLYYFAIKHSIILVDCLKEMSKAFQVCNIFTMWVKAIVFIIKNEY